MRLIIAGSRSINPTIAQLSALIPDLPDLIICGCCEGVDRAGFAWARHYNLSVEFFPAWERQREWALSVAAPDEIIHKCPRVSISAWAGPIRNAEMAQRGTHCLILRTADSKGSINMEAAATERHISLVVKQFQIRHGIAIPA